MNEQDGTQPSTKQRRSRKTSIANQQNGKQTPAAQRPANDDRQPWRTELEIDVERQKYLAKRRRNKPDVEQGNYPFRDIKLSRADVEWLLATHESGGMRGPVNWKDENQREREGLDLRGANLRNVDLQALPLTCLIGGTSIDEELEAKEHMTAGWIHLEGADLCNAHLEGARLGSAYLEGADLAGSHLEGADLVGSHLEGARLDKAHLENSNFRFAHLIAANLNEAHLEKADLSSLHLEKASLKETFLNNVNLSYAQLAGANLSSAHLEGADLSRAHFEGKRMHPDDLERVREWFPGPISHEEEDILDWQEQVKEEFPEELPPANLCGAFFDTATKLDNITLGDPHYGWAQIVDIRWGDTNLATVRWSQMKMLGDEHEARQSKDKMEDLDIQISKYQTSVRANRQLAVVLQDQGLNEDAARFAYRAHVNQREVLYLQVLQALENLPRLRPLLAKPTKNILDFVRLVFYILFILTPLFSLGILSVAQRYPQFYSSYAYLVYLAPSLLLLLILSYLFIFRVSFRLFIIYFILLSLCLFLLISISLLLVLLIKNLIILFALISIGMLLLSFQSYLTFHRALSMNPEGTKELLETNNKKFNQIKNLLGRTHPFFNLLFFYSKYFFSLFLGVLAGYGYRPLRTVLLYLLVILVFAICYNIFGQGQIPLFPDALIFSIASFHGRGFFPSLGDQSHPLTLHTPLVEQAAIEAIIGLIIEVSFIATFTQRFFGK